MKLQRTQMTAWTDICSSVIAPVSPKAPTVGTLLHAIHGVMRFRHSPHPCGLAPTVGALGDHGAVEVNH
jgi:hypothetical protein